MSSESKPTAERDELGRSVVLRDRLDDAARRYYGPLLSFFRKRTSNAADVQDLVQQVFVSLSKQQDGTVQNPDAYVFQTAANALRDYQRRERIRGRFAVGELEASNDSAASSSHLSPERVLLGQEAVARLAAAARELPERTRDVFMLRCFEGLKHAEIARLYGVSVRSVEKHFARALAHISKAME